MSHPAEVRGFAYRLSAAGQTKYLTQNHSAPKDNLLSLHPGCNGGNERDDEDHMPSQHIHSPAPVKCDKRREEVTFARCHVFQILSQDSNLTAPWENPS